MAKSTSKTKPWIINSNGQNVEVVCAYVEIVDGSLMLLDAKGGSLLRAFAPGAWTTLAPKEAAH